MMRSSIIGLSIFLGFYSVSAIDMGHSSPYFLPSIFGDARCNSPINSILWSQNYMFNVRLPPGDHHRVTVAYWQRFLSNGKLDGLAGIDGALTTINYTPEPISEIGTNLIASSLGWPSGTNLIGSSTISLNYSTEPGAIGKGTNSFPRGVYAVVGWSSNSVDFSLGGQSATLGPGEFARNFAPVSSAPPYISGSGPVAIKICQVHVHQFFGGIVAQSLQSIFDIKDGVISNEMSYVVWSIAIDSETNILSRSIFTMDGTLASSIKTAYPLPAISSVRSLSSKGLYQFGLSAFGSDSEWTYDLFFPICVPFFISDSQIQSLIRNGRDELSRRGIPRWK